MTTLTEFLTARINEHEHGLNLMREAVIRAGEQWATLPQAGRDVVSAHLVALGLADCEAKRRILEEVLPTHPDYDPDYIRKILALPYADHPDYQEEWRP